jgi:two-component system chemotaxis response regulator CheB
MPTPDIIVIGASSGGIEALRTLVSELPASFPATVFVTQHMGSESPGILHLILERAGPLPALTPNDKQTFSPGHIYVAPPNHHMLVEPGRICLSRGPKENRFRPAIDPLFRSAAQVYGPRVIGVILTGSLDDGTSGLWVVKRMGGIAIVQDPAGALFPSMPLSALRHVDVDYVVPLAEIPQLLTRLTQTSVEATGVYDVPDNLEIEVRIAKQEPGIDLDVRNLWDASSYTCPDCHGVLLQLEEGGRLRFRCHTGHAFSPDTLLATLTEAVEESLWSTVRTIEESVLLMRHLAKHTLTTDANFAEEFTKKAEQAQNRADVVRRAILDHEELNSVRIEQAARFSAPDNSGIKPRLTTK